MWTAKFHSGVNFRLTAGTPLEQDLQKIDGCSGISSFCKSAKIREEPGGTAHKTTKFFECVIAFLGLMEAWVCLCQFMFCLCHQLLLQKLYYQ